MNTWILDFMDFIGSIIEKIYCSYTWQMYKYFKVIPIGISSGSKAALRLKISFGLRSIKVLFTICQTNKYLCQHLVDLLEEITWLEDFGSRKCKLPNLTTEAESSTLMKLGSSSRLIFLYRLIAILVTANSESALSWN